MPQPPALSSGRSPCAKQRSPREILETLTSEAEAKVAAIYDVIEGYMLKTVVPQYGLELR